MPRVLITAGPTHEPIDAVRFIGNRSSGRLGLALARAAARRRWKTTLLLGPCEPGPVPRAVRLERFRTAEDLRALLRTHAPRCDVLIMAAAVADYRPRAASPGKLRRAKKTLQLRLEPTPDLLAETARRRRTNQLLVGFALEPRARMLASAQDKLRRKGLDLIVANPLETMESGTIEAVVIDRRRGASTPGVLDKNAFAAWLLHMTAEMLPSTPRRSSSGTRGSRRNRPRRRR